MLPLFSSYVISKMKSNKAFGLVDELSSLVSCIDCDGIVVKNVGVCWQQEVCAADVVQTVIGLGPVGTIKFG